ncbi:hypothetical protein [Rhodohalobacter mucosus]|uniref:hypothetical protein n=1 Tax=Rhodohalobacter mucosus TaxID=2079485 RepID=UPI0011B1EE70|nr:hypothetical protein [Rhodohalobacter mucosus]
MAEKGIINGEYCACGTVVPDCPVWSEIIEEWNETRILDLDSYSRIQKKLLSKKKLFQANKILKKQPEEIKNFLRDTENLYDTIFKVTNSDCIIDSSKGPAMIPVLRKLGYNVKVIHLTRRFGDVLNSYKVHLKKDPEKGVEHEIKPLNTFYVLFSWFSKNLLTRFYSRGLEYRRLRYEDYISDLKGSIQEIINVDAAVIEKLKNRGPFHPGHMVAGSRIRMKKEITVARKPVDTSYKRLNSFDRLLARSIDAFY